MSRKGSAGEPGLASNAEDFEDLIGDLEGVEGLDAPWLYRSEGAAYGPITARELLQRLYEGDIDGETEVAPEDGDFLALRRYGVFRNHLERAAERARVRAAAEEKARRELRVQRARRLRWAALAAVSVLLGSGLIWGAVGWFRAAEAESRAEREVAQLEAELEALLANVSIEPPLMPLVDERKPLKSGGRRAGRPPSRAGSKRPSRSRAVLSEREVMTGVQRVFGGLVVCIKGQLRREPDSVPRTVVLTFGINNRGRAQNVSLADRFLRRSPMLGCVRGKLEAARWRAYQGEVRNVEYPITVRRPREDGSRSRLRQP